LGIHDVASSWQTSIGLEIYGRLPALYPLFWGSFSWDIDPQEWSSLTPRRGGSLEEGRLGIFVSFSLAFTFFRWFAGWALDFVVGGASSLFTDRALRRGEAPLGHMAHFSAAVLATP
jgi:hypothetical protein